VIAVCRQPDKAADLRKLAEAHAKDLSVLPLDVTDDASIANAAKEVSTQLEALDLLVNNAGVGQFTPVEDTTREELVRTCDVNVAGVLAVSEAFRPLLERGRIPLIANVSSRLGSLELRRASASAAAAYPVSKAALNMLTIQQSHAYRGAGIAVLALSPGWVRTDMGGPQAELSVEESVGGLLGVIDSRGLEDSGGFFGIEGEAIPW
jgi:NAD(P)-dependent dehydrogenase (short-subunit alcohol dehydrogenase family)